jgi:hypothetical protein
LARCSAITRSGERCKGVAIDATGLCYAHSPDHEEDRRRAASKGGKRGGRGRPVVDIVNLKDQLSNLYDSVLSGETEPKVGAVAAQIANARARLVETELKVKEQQELTQRLEELETLLERQNQGGRRWG